MAKKKRVKVTHSPAVRAARAAIERARQDRNAKQGGNKARLKKLRKYLGTE